MISSQTKIDWLRILLVIVGIVLLVAAFGIYTNYTVLNNWISAGLLVAGILSFLMRYHRLGVLWILLGIFFNPEVPLQLPRQIWVIADLLTLAGIAYFTFWATDPHRKGSRFEKYITSLFPKTEFVVHDRARDNSKFLGRYVESDSNPDVTIRNLKSGKLFAIECKWRERWASGKVEYGFWWDLKKADHYKKYKAEKGIPVYVAFGIGGTPEKPKEIYFLELSKVQWPFLKQSFVRSGKTINQINEIFY